MASFYFQDQNALSKCFLKPGFHIVVSVVSVVRKKFIGQLQIYGNLPHKCSIQKKRQIQRFVRDRMNSICPINFFRTTDTTDTTIWKPGFIQICLLPWEERDNWKIILTIEAIDSILVLVVKWRHHANGLFNIIRDWVTSPYLGSLQDYSVHHLL